MPRTNRENEGRESATDLERELQSLRQKHYLLRGFKREGDRGFCRRPPLRGERERDGGEERVRGGGRGVSLSSGRPVLLVFTTRSFHLYYQEIVLKNVIYYQNKHSYYRCKIFTEININYKIISSI
jgi:hypothetical protein